MSELISAAFKYLGVDFIQGVSVHFEKVLINKYVLYNADLES